MKVKCFNCHCCGNFATDCRSSDDEDETYWWRTTPVATKTRYDGAGGARLRTRIYPLIFISLLRTFDPHVFKRVLVYFPLLFRLLGGFFPFRDPIREAISLCGPLFFYEYF